MRSDRPYKVYLRWYATVTPPGQHSYEWNHALDIAARVARTPLRYTLQDSMGPNGERGFLCLRGAVECSCASSFSPVFSFR
jgi:hypothetical protein